MENVFKYYDIYDFLLHEGSDREIKKYERLYNSLRDYCDYIYDKHKITPSIFVFGDDFGRSIEMQEEINKSGRI